MRVVVRDGFTALKILPVPPARPLEGSRWLRQAESLMGAVRDAVGDDVDVMVDLHGRTTPAAAIQVGRVLAPFRPWFLEEPVQPGNVDALVEVARALPIPIATGERLTTRWEFVELLAKRACAIVRRCAYLPRRRTIAFGNRSTRNGSNTSGRRSVTIISAIACPAGCESVMPSIE
jgi:L-alanine-DL-glutamate epimerase-like enolase superfamily enzyme